MENTKIFAEMTIAEKFVAIANGLEMTNEVKAFLLYRAEKSKKNGGSSKPTKAQIEMTEVTMPLVLNKLAEIGRPVQVGELVKALDLSSQKITSALTKLGDKVVRTTDKGKAFYTVA